MTTGPVDTELRWDDEFVRHKTMDFVGDLALAGKRVRGRIVADRAEPPRNGDARSRDAETCRRGDADERS